MAITDLQSLLEQCTLRELQCSSAAAYDSPSDTTASQSSDDRATKLVNNYEGEVDVHVHVDTGVADAV